MIDNLNTIVPCTSCHTPVAVKDAIAVERRLGLPQDGVYLCCSPICQERHQIARQVMPILHALPPLETGRDDGHYHICFIPRDECECEPEW